MKQLRHGRCLASYVSMALSFFVLMMTTAAVTPCPTTGEPAPAVITLMASKTDPAMEAWIVSPDCTVETIRASPFLRKLDLVIGPRNVERVASVPTDLQTLLVSDNLLTNGADLSNATKLTEIAIIGGQFDSRSLLLPPNLEELVIRGNTLFAGIGSLKLPSSLQSLQLSEVPKMKTLKNAQLSSLQSLVNVTITGSLLTTKDYQFLPTSLKQLWIRDTPLGNLERVIMPPNLEELDLDNCSINRIIGVKWPTSLRRLSFSRWKDNITTLEIRQSDVATFQQLEQFDGSITQTNCVGSGALTEAKSIKLCVIPDSEFDSKYPSSAPPSSEQEDDATDQQSNEGSSDGSAVWGEGSGLQGASSPVPSVATPTIVDAAKGSSTPSSSKLFVILLVVAVIFAVALLYLFVGSRKRQPNESNYTATATDTFELANTPRTAPGADKSDITSAETVFSLSIDISNDRDLVRWRIDKAHIGNQVARGRYGVVYRGKCQGRVVAIKQMVPDTWQSERVVASFLDEIRMCARLSHPKIVEFIGVAWNSLRDLSVITEFMAGGDLHSVIHKYPESLGAEWAHSWSQRNLRSKTLIAKDIAEAVVYLHSYDAPIIHRDLKTKNVLLDPVGNAKLSDFGISRAVSIDETMTSEIGTVAWIAPEVLRGERYSEKADIYSLGVLLVELDRCSHPYATEPALLTDGASNNIGGMSHGAHKNAQIAVLVSTGKLVPSPSRGCPEVVSTLINRCVSYEATDRPTAMQVFYGLRQIQKVFDSA